MCCIGTSQTLGHVYWELETLVSGATLVNPPLGVDIVSECKLEFMGDYHPFFYSDIVIIGF